MSVPHLMSAVVLDALTLTPEITGAGSNWAVGVGVGVGVAVAFSVAFALMISVEAWVPSAS